MEQFTTEQPKFILNKERIAQLTDSQMGHIFGGEAEEAQLSTRHAFTCSWCMGVKAEVDVDGVPVSASTNGNT